MSQSHQVSASVRQGSTTDSESFTAPDFGAFDLSASASVGSGLAMASQTLTILEDDYFARGAVSLSTPFLDDSYSGFASASFDLIFDLRVPSTVGFQVWDDRASGSGQSIVGFLTGPTGTLISCGRIELYSSVFCDGEEVELEPGRYRARVSAVADGFPRDPFDIPGGGATEFAMELWATSVPEPASGGLIALGLLGPGAGARRRPRLGSAARAAR